MIWKVRSAACSIFIGTRTRLLPSKFTFSSRKPGSPTSCTSSTWREATSGDRSFWRGIRSARHPLGAVPAIELDGFALAESNAIVRYLAMLSAIDPGTLSNTPLLAGRHARLICINHIAAVAIKFRPVLNFAPLQP